MISAEAVGMLACIAGAITVWYAIRNLATADTVDARDARYAAWAWLLCVVVAVGSFTYANYADATPAPVPGPPAPGPNPPAPTPSTFAAQVQAATKADGVTPGIAHELGKMAVALGQTIVQQPATFKDAAHIGATWETYRGKIFQPMGKWCPRTMELLASELKARGLHTGAITDHAAHANLWDEFGKALLAYE